MTAQGGATGDVRRVRSGDLDLVVETSGDGPPLVFAHGLSGHRGRIFPELAPLADRFRIVTYDQRGHGESAPVTVPAIYDARNMAEDLTAVMDALGIQRAILGGQSMGAATTLLFALAHPERVEALLLTAPAFSDRPNPAGQGLKDMATAIETLGMDEWLRRAEIRQREVLGWSPQVIEEVRDSFRSHDPASIATALRTVGDWRIVSDLSVFSVLTCPTCIIAWEGDALHPHELAQRLAAVMPNARLETVAPLPAIFVDPPLVGRVYRRFLEEL